MNNLTRKFMYLNPLLALFFAGSQFVEPVSARGARSYQNHRVKIWVKSFIPYPRIDMTRYGPCFSGDNRSFSEATDAPCRTHQEIEFDVASQTLVHQNSFTGKTHRVDCSTNTTLVTAQARSDRIRNGPVTVQGQTVTVRMSLAANNPLVFGAPDVDLNISLYFDWRNSSVTLTGMHDGFPAFEIYMSVDGGRPIKLYRFSPAGNGVSDHLKLFYPMEERIRPVTQSLGFAALKRP